MFEFVCILLIIVGLAICVGGIYLKKVAAGLTGLLWGAVLGILISLLIAMQVDIDTPIFIVIASVFAIIMALLAITFDRFCVCINSLFSSAALFFVIALMVTEGEFEIAIAVAIIFALISAGVSFKFYDYAFIISTALTGGFIASLSGTMLINKATLFGFIFGNGAGQVLIITFALAIVGFIVQLQKLKSNKKAQKT